MIITFSNTSSKPNTVMIKPQYAVVAYMTMRSPGWSKYITSLTIFKLE